MVYDTVVELHLNASYFSQGEPLQSSTIRLQDHLAGSFDDVVIRKTRLAGRGSRQVGKSP